MVCHIPASNRLQYMQANTLLQAEKDKELEAILEAATAKMRETEAGWACERDSFQSQLNDLTTDLAAAQSKCKELEASKETCVPFIFCITIVVHVRFAMCVYRVHTCCVRMRLL